MSGLDIVGTLLRADAAITDDVPIERIKGGALPDGIDLPALLIREVSEVEPRQPLKRGSTVRTVVRVAVTVRAANYRDQRAILDKVKTCCAGLTGDIGGGSRVSILTAGRGPDLRGPGDSFERTQDFRVSYDAIT